MRGRIESRRPLAEARIPSRYLQDEESFLARAETGWKCPAPEERACPRLPDERILRRRVEHRWHSDRVRMQAGDLPGGSARTWSDKPQQGGAPLAKRSSQQAGSALTAALLLEFRARRLLPCHHS